ncbi:MAG: RluA family pseudouridine synthase [Acidobacteriota bacterium]
MSGDTNWTVSSDDAGQRLDRFVSERLGISRSKIRRWILDGRIQLSERVAKPGLTLREGEQLECRPPDQPVESRLLPQDEALDLLFEDPDVVVVDKPAGLAVHPGAGRAQGTLANRLLHRYPEIMGVGGPGRPGIVHRLDIDTTGAIIVARSERAYQRLSEAFAERRVEKTYVAVAYGTPREQSGSIDSPIGRHRHHRKRMAVRADGRAALTRYTTMASATGISRLRIHIETGRTHQIRVHLKALGNPLVGDPVYGEARWRNLPRSVQPALRDFPRPALHARRLAFEHPTTGEPMAVEAPLPKDLEQLWQAVAGCPWD